MSLDRFPSGSPLSANFPPAPSDSDQCLHQDFPDDIFGGTSELSQALSGQITSVELLTRCAKLCNAEGSQT